MTIEFTNEEAQVVVNLIDTAIRAGGLKVAAAALEITNKVVAAAQAEGQQVTMVDEMGAGAPPPQTAPAQAPAPAAIPAG